MFARTYKNLLNQIPTGVVVLDRKYGVRFANAAFRRQFFSDKIAGSLKEVLRCTVQTRRCGEGEDCALCPFRLAFQETIENGKEDFRKIVMPVYGEEGIVKLALRLKIKPMGKYALGLLDDAYETEIVQELQNAQSIQQRLLPAGKQAGGIAFSYLYLPCREIGGDLPDVYEIGRDTVGVIADVSGKGISAGMLSAFVKAGWDKAEPSPAEAISKLNAKFKELNMDERSYVTAEAVNINSDQKTFTYSAAGHIVPILLKSGFKINEITYKSPPVSNWMDGFDYQDNTMPYRPGDMLVLMTDGIIESKNKNGEQFGIERVESVLLRTRSARAFIERLQAELKEFCETFNDDLTAIAFDLE